MPGGAAAARGALLYVRRVMQPTTPPQTQYAPNGVLISLTEHPIAETLVELVGTGLFLGAMGEAFTAGALVPFVAISSAITFFIEGGLIIDPVLGLIGRGNALFVRKTDCTPIPQTGVRLREHVTTTNYRRKGSSAVVRTERSTVYQAVFDSPGQGEPKVFYSASLQDETLDVIGWVNALLGRPTPRDVRGYVNRRKTVLTVRTLISLAALVLMAGSLWVHAFPPALATPGGTAYSHSLSVVLLLALLGLPTAIMRLYWRLSALLQKPETLFQAGPGKGGKIALGVAAAIAFVPLLAGLAMVPEARDRADHVTRRDAPVEEVINPNARPADRAVAPEMTAPTTLRAFPSQQAVTATLESDGFIVTAAQYPDRRDGIEYQLTAAGHGRLRLYIRGYTVAQDNASGYLTDDALYMISGRDAAVRTQIMAGLQAQPSPMNAQFVALLQSMSMRRVYDYSERGVQGELRNGSYRINRIALDVGSVRRCIHNSVAALCVEVSRPENAEGWMNWGLGRLGTL